MWIPELLEDSSLLHHLDIDLGHVHLPIELGWKFGPFQQFGIDRSRHSCRPGKLPVVRKQCQRVGRKIMKRGFAMRSIAPALLVEVRDRSLECCLVST